MTQTPPMLLLVEDDPDIASMLDALLSLDGATVVVVTTAADAIAYLQQHPPDLVLSDFYLSAGTGWEVYQFLRAHPRYHTLPFLLLSAMPPTIRGAPDPFLCIMTKPFVPDALLTCLHALLHPATSAPVEARTRLPE